MSEYWGMSLKVNLMAGRPSRMKSVGDYKGYPIEPCGEYQGISHALSTPPWLLHSSTSSGNTSLSLHEEIKLYVSYMAPTKEEMAIRNDLVTRFKKLIASLNMGATVQPVGSCCTGLFLPTSDIDMVLSFKNRYSSLTTIYYEISRSGFASKMENVLNASVPLIRITDKVSGIEIDLTQADTHGIKATQAVTKWRKDEPYLIKAIVLVVKMFLSIRRCGTTYTGGLNSYVLVWLVVAWVKLELPKLNIPKYDDLTSLMERLERLSVGGTGTTGIGQASTHPADSYDLGKILTAFFKFYGVEFDYYQKKITIEPQPYYGTKRYSSLPYLLSIYDPADGTIDMGSKCYAIKHVQASFAKAFTTLQSLERRAARGSTTGQSVLNQVLQGDFTKFVQKRNNLRTSITGGRR